MHVLPSGPCRAVPFSPCTNQHVDCHQWTAISRPSNKQANKRPESPVVARVPAPTGGAGCGSGPAVRHKEGGRRSMMMIKKKRLRWETAGNPGGRAHSGSGCRS